MHSIEVRVKKWTGFNWGSSYHTGSVTLLINEEEFESKIGGRYNTPSAFIQYDIWPVLDRARHLATLLGQDPRKVKLKEIK